MPFRNYFFPLFCMFATACAVVGNQEVRRPADVSIVAQAETLMRRQTGLFDAGIYATSGFGDPVAMQKFAEGAGADSRLAFRILNGEEVEIAIAAPERLRAAIAAGGFKNTYETGKSGGSATGDRNVLEARYVGMQTAAYTKLPDSLKPKYGFLAPKPHSLTAAMHESHSLVLYGEDRWVLRLDRVRERLSLSVSDSLDKMGRMGEDDGSAPPDLAALYAKRQRHWYYHFVPWSRRTLLTPALAKGIGPVRRETGAGFEQRTFGHTVGAPLLYALRSSDWMQEQGYFQGDMYTTCVATALAADDGEKKIPYGFCTNLGKVPPPLKHYCPDCLWSTDYLEAQIWGSVAPEDILAFVYSHNPPSEELARLFAERGIEVRDGRTQL